MGLDPHIAKLLSGVSGLTETAAGARRPVVGDSPRERLEGIVARIGNTVLPRSYTIFVGSDPAAVLTVASGRMLKLVQPGGEDAAAATPISGNRDARLAAVARALAELAQGDAALSCETNYIADDLAAEDVGQTATELETFFSDNDWFDAVGQEGDSFLARAARQTLAQAVVGNDGSVTDVSGDPALAEGLAALTPLVADITALESDIADLAGSTGLIILRGGPGQKALSIAPGEGGMIVALCDDAKVAPLAELWNRLCPQEDAAK